MNQDYSLVGIMSRDLAALKAMGPEPETQRMIRVIETVLGKTKDIFAPPTPAATYRRFQVTFTITLTGRYGSSNVARFDYHELRRVHAVS